MELAWLALEYHRSALPSLCEAAHSPCYTCGARSHTHHHHPKGETSSTAAAYSSLRTSAEQCARTRKALELSWSALEYHHLALPSMCEAAHSPCYTCGARSHTHHHPKGETVTADHVNKPLECYASIPLFFLYNFLPNFLPIFLYAFIGDSLETVGGMGYGVLGMVFIGGMGW